MNKVLFSLIYFNESENHLVLDKLLNSSRSDKMAKENKKIITKIISDEIEKLSSNNLVELRKILRKVFKDRKELSLEIMKTEGDIIFQKNLRLIGFIFLIGIFFHKSITNKLKIKKEYLLDLKNRLNNTFIEIDVYFDKSMDKQYIELENSFSSLMRCEKIWDITSEEENDEYKSSADIILSKEEVKIDIKNIEFIRSTYSALHFENKNGGDLYIFPTFIYVDSVNDDIEILDIRDMSISFKSTINLEYDEFDIPSDSKIIGTTWQYVNKKGGPDKRFSENYEISEVRYGELIIQSKSGFFEEYQFSNVEKAQNFYNAFYSYQQNLK